MAQPTSTSVQKDAHPFERASLESLLIRRFFFAPAFEIYGGQFITSPSPSRSLESALTLSLRLWPQVSRVSTTM